MRLILASASARRRELLTAAGVPFVVDPVEADERRLPDEPPVEYATRVALAKARAGLVRHPSDVVLGADTIVLVDDLVLGKPADEADAVAMLGRLSGRGHDVITGVALAWHGHERSFAERTRVWFAPLSPDDIRSYVSTGEPRDKAGAYAIQGGAARFVTRVDGSYSNVVGLPVAAVLQYLTEAGVETGRPGTPTGPV
jgi:septum formation protein